MIYPTFQQFKDLRRKYKMIGISMEIAGDTETPITLFKKIGGGGNSYLLESVEGGEKRGRYSYIGRNPFMIIKAYGRKTFIQEGDETCIQEGNPLELIRKIMEDYKAPYMEKMPDFTGGAVGYIAYDMARNYLELTQTKEDDIQLPDLHLILTKEVIVYDHVKQKIIIIVNSLLKGEEKGVYKMAVERLKEIEREIFFKELSLNQEENQQISPIEYCSNETKETFMKKVDIAKEYIKKGEIFQVVLSQRLQINTELNAFEVYRNLRSVNPSPYLFYIDFNQYQIIGSSPEIMVKVKEKKVKICPIAGTKPRGKTLEEDERLMAELLQDKKEIAEHLMLVDLAREDIKKISKQGTVKIEEYMDICKYSHVMHIVSNIVGELKEDYDMYDALIASLPAGTLSGAPKVKAMEIIDELENKKRGFYGGAVGYLGFNGNMDTCIAIRSILFKDKKAYLQAGAGIVADSNAEEEYKETQRKLAALVETLEISKRDIDIKGIPLNYKFFKNDDVIMEV